MRLLNKITAGLSSGLLFPAFILVRCWVFYQWPEPYQVPIWALIFTVAVMVGAAVAMRYHLLRRDFGFLILGIILLDLLTRVLSLKPLLFAEAALALILAGLEFRYASQAKATKRRKQAAD